MEPLTQTTVLAIQDPSQVAVARRAASDFAAIAQLDEHRTSATKIVAVELANNLIQHAGGGQMYFRYLENMGALDIAAVDHGKGMPSVDRCMEDGFSTGSTPGLGLGAVRRFAVRFGAYSIPGRTTVVAARMAERKTEPDFTVICTAVQGERLSGDSWAMSEDGRTILMIDGLGHGMFAADAARMGVEMFLKHQHGSPQEILERMHPAMRATRGAAAAIAFVESFAPTIGAA